MIRVSARELALHVLAERFGPPRSAEPLLELAAFQRDAHQRLLLALERFGGALLADSVGLGKTFVAAAVARTVHRQTGATALAVVPASLRAAWVRALRQVPGATVVTHATLSRGGGYGGGRAGLVVVDEAHAFRNPRTRRYAALARLVAGRPVLLLTATPINNSAWDLYWLLRLFANDDAFTALGVADLAACCEGVQRSGRSGRLPAVLGAVAVRRTRALVAPRAGAVEVGGSTLAFPERAPPRAVSYALPDVLLPVLTNTIEELELKPWQNSGPTVGGCLLRLTLLKRLESSVAALRASLVRLEDVTGAFVAALRRGLLLGPGDRAAPQRDSAQLELTELVLRPLPTAADVAALERSAARDLELLRAALAQLATGAAPDSKLVALNSLLRAELAERPVLLFTEYRDTAEYLWRQLRTQVPCALIHGSAAWLGPSPSTRRAVVERFAPLANAVRPPGPRERVQLLIATDVLSEGLNLQDAADVISYDLPWNPIRLVQRLGRIDRLGSRHQVVRSWYFAPQRELEPLLGLLGRIRSKLRTIRAAVGADAAVLETASPRTVRRLANGDAGAAWAGERRRDGLFDTEERLRSAWHGATATAADPLAGLPLAGVPAGSAAPPLEPPPAGAARQSRVALLDMPGALWADRPPARLPTALVFIRNGSALRAVFVGRGRGFEDDVAAGELILRALQDPRQPGRLAPPAARRAARAATGWLERRGAPAVRRRPGTELRARLVRLLESQPGGPTAEECRRVEVLVAALERNLGVAEEVALRSIRRQPGARALATLLDRLEALLRDPPRPAADFAEPVPRRGRVVAVMLLERPGAPTP